MKINQIRLLKNATLKSARLAEKWMLNNLSDNDAIRNNNDPILYYKWPLTLIARGRNNEASRLLKWINQKCLTDEGDYLSSRSGFHKEFHTYSSLWLILAAIRLGETELTEKLMGFILKYHNNITGGLATFPAIQGKVTEDLVSSSFLGMVACESKNKALADKILHYLESVLSQNADNGKFWVRLNHEGSIIKSIPTNSDIKTYVIDLGKEQECYYFLGAACYFLARYIETFDHSAISLSNSFASILEKVGNKALATIWAAKVAPGCMALYSITSDKRFFNLAYPVIQIVLKEQTQAGYWSKEGKPWITVSAEQCFWLTDISNRI